MRIFNQKQLELIEMCYHEIFGEPVHIDDDDFDVIVSNETIKLSENETESIKKVIIKYVPSMYEDVDKRFKSVYGMARCREDDIFDHKKGVKLAKLRFLKKLIEMTKVINWNRFVKYCKQRDNDLKALDDELDGIKMAILSNSK